MAAKAEEKLVGRITHYYSHLGVGIIELTGGELKVGDVIHVRGKHTDFTQSVDSIQIEGISSALKENTPTSPRAWIPFRSNTRTSHAPRRARSSGSRSRKKSTNTTRSSALNRRSVQAARRPVQISFPPGGAYPRAA